MTARKGRATCWPAPERCSPPTPARSCCSTRSGTSSSPTRPLGSRKSCSRASTSRSARASPDGLPAELRPVVLPDVDHADVLNPLIRRKGIASLVGVPLVVDGRPIGVIHVGTLEPRDFTRDDVDLLQLAADRVAIALSHAQALDAERAARVRVEHVQAIIDAGLAHLELDALLAELLDRIRTILGVDTVAVLLVDPERRELVARAAVGLEEEVEQGVRIPLGQRLRRPDRSRRQADRILADVDHAEVLNPLLRRRASSPCSASRSRSASTSIGVLHVGTLDTALFTRDETELLELVAERLARRDREGARARRDDRPRRAEAQLRRGRLARAADAHDRRLRDPDDAPSARRHARRRRPPPARADRLGAGRSGCGA